MSTAYRTPDVVDTLKKWNISFENQLARIDARILPQEVIKLGTVPVSTSCR